ncbi:MAG: hypothetical protein AB7V32_09110 [Candidatus Berkiella sp.]
MMQYISIAAILSLQALAAYEALHRGYSLPVVALIFFLPIIGPLAFFIYENGADFYYRMRRLAHRANRAFGTQPSPFKELAKLQQKVRIHPTIENQHRLAKIYFQIGQFHESIKLLDNVLAQSVFSNDPYLLIDKAQAYFAMHSFEEAKITLDLLRNNNPTFQCASAQLLLARTFSELGHWQLANKEFERLESQYHGLEASFYYLQHLRKLNNQPRAKEVFLHMQQRFDRLPQHYRSSQKSWLKQAQREQQ